MSQILIKDVVNAIEESFPPRWQEDFDNTGLQVGDPLLPCSGALICVDATVEIVKEACRKGCNLIITHHPLIFHPIKRIVGDDRVTLTLVEAIRNIVAIYSCHTSVDNAPENGVSWVMGRMLGLQDIKALENRGAEHIGSGVVGNLPQPMTAIELIELVKRSFDSPVARCSNPDLQSKVGRVALCGGAGGHLIREAMDEKADVFIVSDSKHNQFIDWLGHILLVDIGHYESEKCTKRIFYDVISKKIPNFALCYSEEDNNPIYYL